MNWAILPEDESALDESIKTVQPIDAKAAAELLREAKRILDKEGITFALVSGTCLGAVRDNQLIPWDDDMDLGSVLGLNGLTEEKIERVANAFRDNGFIVGIAPQDYCISVLLLKDSVRIDWSSFRIIDDSTFHYPGVRIPARMLTDLKEINFIGEKFRVPNPPEEYLCLKYGKDWTSPKKAGQYEADVLSQIPERSAPGRAGKLKQFTVKYLLPWRATRIRVLDSKGNPVTGAEVVVAGLGRSRTNNRGCARLYIPRKYVYALVIRFRNHEEVLYEEELGPGKTYLYRPDVQSRAGRYFTLIPESQAEPQIVRFCREAAFSPPGNSFAMELLGVFLSRLWYDAAVVACEGVLHKQGVLMGERDRIRWIYSSGGGREMGEGYDQWAQDYDAYLKHGHDCQGTKLTAEYPSRFVPNRAKILDAGAGTGLVGKVLSKLGYNELVAVDLSPGMLPDMPWIYAGGKYE